MKSNKLDLLVTIEDAELREVAGAGLLTGDNSFALLDLSNLLGLGNVGLLGDATSSNTTTNTSTAKPGLLGLGILGIL
jgi:hypothetical protein